MSDDDDDNVVAPELLVQAADALDRIFNGDATGTDRKVGFVLVVSPFGDPDITYITNLADRRMMADILRDQADWFEEHADDAVGHA